MPNQEEVNDLKDELHRLKEEKRKEDGQWRHDTTTTLKNVEKLVSNMGTELEAINRETKENTRNIAEINKNAFNPEDPAKNLPARIQKLELSHRFISKICMALMGAGFLGFADWLAKKFGG